MKVVAVLSVFILVVCTVSATPCTDICGGECALRKQACSFVDVFSSLCETEDKICTKSCDAACGCVDTCATKCGGKYATCKEGGNAILNFYSCGVSLSYCASTCHAKCKFQLFSSIVGAITGGLMPTQGPAFTTPGAATTPAP
ncbi:hypothetical protein PoB_004522600 [Plakobranchus ocellatus]|uniref:Uncharacterized protein n=1 Tax=Plakobranchus ocellatus TaxID=259542 RepID=A0AAV4BIH1_9GAST|nr:hypothetical protein PoB_004522600 [Plakobranchus ocellatus]